MFWVTWILFIVIQLRSKMFSAKFFRNMNYIKTANELYSINMPKFKFEQFFFEEKWISYINLSIIYLSIQKR